MINLSISNKSYKKRTFIKDVNLKIDLGDFVIISGKSGCGKSTVMNILNLLDNNFEGSYEIGSVDVKNLSASKKADFRKNHFGIIFQDYNLIQRMTVVENIMFALDLIGYSGDKKLRALEVLDLVELTNFQDYRVNEISGGQQQRVGIARAIAGDPDIIFADEPTGNLDEITSLDIMKLLKQLNESGKTIILVAHNPNLYEFSNRRIVLNNGQLISDVKQVNKEKNIYLKEAKNHVKFTSLVALSLKNLRLFKLRYLFTNIIIILSLLILAIILGSYNSINEESFYTVDMAYTEVPSTDNGFVDYDYIASLLDDVEIINQYDFYGELTNINGDIITEPNYVNLLNYNNEYNYYLEAGTDPILSNEIVVSESFIKLYLDSGYDIKHGDPSKYLGEKLYLEMNNSVGEADTSESLAGTFTIVGVDNSLSSDVDYKQTNLFVNGEAFFETPSYQYLKVSPVAYNSSEEIADILIAAGYGVEYINQANEWVSRSVSGAPLLQVYYNDGDHFIYRIFFVISLFISLIVGLSLVIMISRREQELGIYYSLGFNKYDLFKTLSIEIITNSVLVTTFVTLILMSITSFLYYKEYIILPVRLFNNIDYVILLIFGVVTSLIALIFVLMKVTRHDPIKIIRKI